MMTILSTKIVVNEGDGMGNYELGGHEPPE